MDAKELLRDGDLSGALSELQGQIRSDPSNVTLRIFLFELLSVLGDWARAGKQLDVLADLDPGSLAIVHLYRDALLCEQLRSEVFTGAKSPMVFGEPEEWLALLTEGLRQADSQMMSARVETLERAYDMAPAVGGTINGEEFSWIADADARLGPVLETLVNGKYYWVPFHRIQRIVIEAPQNLREYVWMPANFIWSNGGESFGLIPTRYVNSERSDDSRVQAARLTEWEEFVDGLYTGLGQRMLTTDNGDYPLMDVREINLTTAA